MIFQRGAEGFFRTFISFFRSFISFLRSFISPLGGEFSFPRELLWDFFGRDWHLDVCQSRYLRREFSYSKFEQTLILPDNVDEERIQARMADGVLTLSIPKISEEDQQKARRTIAIE